MPSAAIDDRSSVRPRPDAVIFDVGGVLVRWNPDWLYRKLIRDPSQRRRFLSEVCSEAWNAEQDRGRSFADGVRELSARFPQHADLIAAYSSRWYEMLHGEVAGMAGLLGHLRDMDVPMYGITNWSAEKFPLAQRGYAILGLLRDVVVSGEVGLVKPDPSIFRYALRRFGVEAHRCVFVDDVAANVSGAEAVGIPSILFTGPGPLRRALRRYRLPVTDELDFEV